MDDKIKITDTRARKKLAEFNRSRIEESNKDFINIMLYSMFEYSTNDENNYDVFFENLEELLCENGCCGIFEYENELICSQINFVGNRNVYGKGIDAICITKNGKEFNFKNWRENDKLVVCFNTKNHVNDKKAFVSADILTEIDVSIKAGTIGTRYNKLLSVANQKEAEKLKGAIELNQLGVPQVITSEINIKKILEEKEQSTIYDLTSIKDSDKMQYLSKLKDDTIRQLFNVYGLNIQGTSKMAQQTVSEIENGAESSFIIPLSKYEERKKAIEKINKQFGKNWEVHFSRVWEIAYESLIEKTEKIELNENDEIVNKEDNTNIALTQNENENLKKEEENNADGGMGSIE